MGKRQYSQPGFTSSVRNGRQRLKKLQDAIFSREIYATGNSRIKTLIICNTQWETMPVNEKNFLLCDQYVSD
jgi:precorrin isomerase